jgi:predicted alpha/beta-fold hydrolase
MQSFRLNPPFLLKPAGVQTLLASAGLRAWGKNPMLGAARQTILTTVDGIRLLGGMSRHPLPHDKGLVILLHGWEGSSAFHVYPHHGPFFVQPRL